MRSHWLLAMAGWIQFCKDRTAIAPHDRWNIWTVMLRSPALNQDDCTMYGLHIYQMWTMWTVKAQKLTYITQKRPKILETQHLCLLFLGQLQNVPAKSFNYAMIYDFYEIWNYRGQFSSVWYFQQWKNIYNCEFLDIIKFYSQLLLVTRKFDVCIIVNI